MKSAALIEFRVGQRVPGTDWVMRGVVGQGGMGVVLEVSKGRNLRAAMKVLRPAFARSAEFESRFAEEVEVMARLRHPNIVEVWDCGVLADGCPFLLMELLTGRTIRAVARDKALRFTAETVWKIVGQICAGLSYAHNDTPPVVHRDVKPENVFLHGRRNFESRVKLLDFGIAKVLGTALAAEEVAGTPRYIAPEVLRKEPLSAKVDLYALAVLVYELLTQGFPWELDIRSADAVSEAHLKRAPTAPSRWKSWIPKSVDGCLLQALSKDPERRQRTVAEFYEQLAELQVVDDGSAKYRTDAPTVPTVATLASGRIATVRADHRDVDSSAKATPSAARGGWLEIARSRLHDGTDGGAPPLAAGSEVTRVPTHSSERAPSEPHVAYAGEEAETPLDVDLEDLIVRAADGNPADTPLTGASVRRVESRARVSPVALLLGAGVITIGTLGGWKAWHSVSASAGATSRTEDPATHAVAAASAQDMDRPPEPPRDEVPRGRVVGELDRAPIPSTAATAPPESDGGTPRLSVLPRAMRGGRPVQRASNLDDVIFAPDEPLAPLLSGSAERRDVVAAAPGAGRSIQRPHSLDDAVLGSDALSGKAPMPSARSASVAPAVSEARGPPLVPRAR